MRIHHTKLFFFGRTLGKVTQTMMVLRKAAGYVSKYGSKKKKRNYVVRQHANFVEKKKKES